MTATEPARALRYVEGFGLRSHAAGLDVVGGKRTARLNAEDGHASTLRVVDLIRAGHSLDAIAEGLGLPVNAVLAGLRPLIRLGVLTGAAGPRPGAPPQMVRFLERTLGVETAAAAIDRLARSTVYLDGNAGIRGLMAGQLRGCGVGTISGLAGGAAGTAPGTNGSPLLVISARPPPRATTPHGGPAADLPTLFVTPGADGARVGPLCDVPGGRCRHCLDMSGRPSPDGITDPIALRVAIALAVGEAVRHLSGTGYCRTLGGAILVRDGGRDQSFELIARDLRCARCGLPGVTLPPEAIRAYRAFQAADVPIRANWSYPILPVHAPGADSTMTVHPWPDDMSGERRRPEPESALGTVADVFAPRAAGLRDRVPSLGGAKLLNVFAARLTGDRARLWYLDRRGGSLRPLPVGGLASSSLLSAGHLTIIIGATLSRAENVFGAKAYLTVYQDTGFALGALRAALASNGFNSLWRPAPADLPDEVVRALGLDPERDVVTAIVDVELDQRPGGDRQRPRRRTARRTPAAPVRREDLDAVLAAVSHDDVETFVRCYRVDGLEDGLYQVTRGPAGAGLRRAPVAAGAVDMALADRGANPDALVVFTADIGHALAGQGAAGINACVVAQAQSAQQARQAARERGLDALLLADLPSTALAPDGRGWRTAHRSVAAVALAPHGALGDGGESAVRW